jgi:hypothetical protein
MPRISTRAGRGTYVSMGCLGWSVLFFLAAGLIYTVIQWLAHP